MHLGFLQFTDQKADNKVDEVTLQVVCVFPTSVHIRSLNPKYTNGKLIEVKPTQLRFPFELKKQIPCSIFISNKTDDHIALKLTSTNWVDYSIRPSMAILLPRSTCEAIVLMEEQRKAPRNMRCNVTFSVYAVVTFAGATVKDIVAHKMFFRESGNTVDMVDLEAIYVSLPKPPSSVPERCDNGSLYGASAKATLLKICNGLVRRRMWKSYTKIKPLAQQASVVAAVQRQPSSALSGRNRRVGQAAAAWERGPPPGTAQGPVAWDRAQRPGRAASAAGTVPRRLGRTAPGTRRLPAKQRPHRLLAPQPTH
ncbi:uncharacterized protein A4U43_C06F1930 [Asparagus officinalis]|uniref:MSP domain-containing protein n=1 Tax=Asparagus officinalis TaxID=4686 RepID=A0A5P1EMV0_ASPOF|nr:uncharacterized protein A4U43_C06F1930 [Asparagus officinalis]